MKTIQITVDTALLEELDSTEEVRRDGRSAFFRRAVEEYLCQRRRAEIAAHYGRAYARQPGLGREFKGWAEQGKWPVE